MVTFRFNPPTRQHLRIVEKQPDEILRLQSKIQPNFLTDFGKAFLFSTEILTGRLVFTPVGVLNKNQALFSPSMKYF